MADTDPKENVSSTYKSAMATAVLAEATKAYQPNLVANTPRQPLAVPIAYNPPGLALLRFSGTILTMVAMAQVYVGLEVTFKIFIMQFQL